MKPSKVGFHLCWYLYKVAFKLFLNINFLPINTSMSVLKSPELKITSVLRGRYESLWSGRNPSMTGRGIPPSAPEKASWSAISFTSLDCKQASQLFWSWRYGAVESFKTSRKLLYESSPSLRFDLCYYLAECYEFDNINIYFMKTKISFINSSGT